MSEQDNVALVKRVYAGLEAGDIPGVLDTMADNVDFKVPNAASAQWSSPRRGRQDVQRFFEEMNGAEQVENVSFDEFIAQGDKVAVVGTWRAKTKATGRVWETAFAHVYTIRDGKAQAVNSIYDTGVIAEAHGK